MKQRITLPPWATSLVAMLALVIGGLAIGVNWTDSDGDGKTDSVEFTVNVKPGDGAKPVDVSVPAPVVAQAKVALESQLKDQTPPLAEQVAPEQLEAAQDRAQEIQQNQTALPTAGASAGFEGCVTRFVRNQSSRNGVRPQHQTLHYTVSFNRPGWSDVNAIIAMFDRSSFGASSNFVIDAEGNCAYIVPIENKSWTQAAANPFAISYEIIAYGNETAYLDPAGYRKLSSVMKQVAARTGIPVKRVGTNGCSPSARGVVQHYDYGICGGGHHDIKPFSVDQVVKIVAAGPDAAITSKLTKGEKKIVSRRCYHWYKHQQVKGAVKQEQLRFSRHWKSEAADQRRAIVRAHARGGSWKTRSRGTRQQVMAKTERMNKKDRRALCAT